MNTQLNLANGRKLSRLDLVYWQYWGETFTTNGLYQYNVPSLTEVATDAKKKDARSSQCLQLTEF